MTTDTVEKLARITTRMMGLFQDLETAKYTPAPRGERVMRPTPGPRTPAPIFLISLDKAVCDDLFELCRDAANTVDPSAILHHDGPRLSRWAYDHRATLARLDWADDLIDAFEDINAHLAKHLTPESIAALARQPERRMTNHSIAYKLRAHGLPVSADLVRKWGERGHITVEDMPLGQRGYLLTEAIAWAAVREEQKQTKRTDT